MDKFRVNSFAKKSISVPFRRSFQGIYTRTQPGVQTPQTGLEDGRNEFGKSNNFHRLWGDFKG